MRFIWLKLQVIVVYGSHYDCFPSWNIIWWYVFSFQIQRVFKLSFCCWFPFIFSVFLHFSSPKSISLFPPQASGLLCWSNFSTSLSVKSVLLFNPSTELCQQSHISGPDLQLVLLSNCLCFLHVSSGLSHPCGKPSFWPVCVTSLEQGSQISSAGSKHLRNLAIPWLAIPKALGPG